MGLKQAGDTIKCFDADDAIEVASALGDEGCDWEFDYSDGIKIVILGKNGGLMTREEVLAKAKECICGEREMQYGDPEDSFSTVAALWERYLEADAIGAEDVALMMALFKIVRIMKSSYESEDSWVDAIGYLACGAEIATKGKR